MRVKVMLLVFVLTLAAGAEERWTHKRLPISLVVPAGWHVGQESDRVTLGLRERSSREPRFFIRLTEMSAEEFEKFVHDNAAEMKHEVAAVKDTTIAGHPARRYELALTGAHGWMALVRVSEGTSYWLLAEAALPEWKTFGPEVERILRGLKLGDHPAP